MNISERLDELRQAVPGCSLVAFGDLGTRLVLRNSAATQPPQEYLDQLCAQAEQGFCLQDKLSSPGTGDRREANIIVITPQETRVYIRSASSDRETANDAILCVCDNEDSAQTLVSPASDLLDDFAGGA